MASQIGLVGIGLMGENLALNIASKGFGVSVFDIDSQRVSQFTAGRAQGLDITGCYSLQGLILSLAQSSEVALRRNRTAEHE